MTDERVHGEAESGLRANTRVGAVTGLLVAALLVGCGGATTPAPEPVTPEPAPAEAPVEAPEAAPSAQPATGTEESWEGEAEATAAPSASDDRVETRTTEVIAKIIRDNRQPFRDCYEQGAKELPDLQGTLTLHFVLDPEGKVKLAELNQERSTIKAPPVVSCALAALKTLKFPPSSRGMESTVNYPFDFKRGTR